MAYRAIHVEEQRAEVERLERTLAALKACKPGFIEQSDIKAVEHQLRVATDNLWAAEVQHREMAASGPGECRCAKHLALADEFERWSHGQWLEWLAEREAGIR